MEKLKEFLDFDSELEELSNRSWSQLVINLLFFILGESFIVYALVQYGFSLLFIFGLISIIIGIIGIRSTILAMKIKYNKI